MNLCEAAEHDRLAPPDEARADLDVRFAPTAKRLAELRICVLQSGSRAIVTNDLVN